MSASREWTIMQYLKWIAVGIVALIVGIVIVIIGLFIESKYRHTTYETALHRWTPEPSSGKWGDEHTKYDAWDETHIVYSDVDAPAARGWRGKYIDPRVTPRHMTKFGSAAHKLAYEPLSAKKKKGK